MEQVTLPYSHMALGAREICPASRAYCEQGGDDAIWWSKSGGGQSGQNGNSSLLEFSAEQVARLLSQVGHQVPAWQARGALANSLVNSSGHH